MTRPITFRIWLDGALVAEPTLEQSTIKIGNANTSHIRLEHSSVSRVHCVIEVGPELEIMDLGSTAGTFVNSAPVTRALIVTGDQLRIGDFLLDVIAAEPTNLLGAPLRTRDTGPPPTAAPGPALRAPSLLDVNGALGAELPAPPTASFVVPGEPQRPRPTPTRLDTVELHDSDLFEIAHDADPRAGRGGTNGT